MHIVVKANDEQKQEFLTKGFPDNVWVSFMDDGVVPGADAYFDLCFEEDGPAFTGIDHKPVFANAVITTTHTLPSNYIRINAWSGFLQRDIIELATADANLSQIKPVMDGLAWKYQLAPDVPGMIAARVIAMIINEAYFGLGDEISTKAEIDIAMKLGTNYPYGPFEWSEKIGLKKIYSLLKKLNETGSRYSVAPVMQKEI